jgi:hypothetical protein
MLGMKSVVRAIVSTFRKWGIRPGTFPMSFELGAGVACFAIFAHGCDAAATVWVGAAGGGAEIVGAGDILGGVDFGSFVGRCLFVGGGFEI